MHKIDLSGQRFGRLTVLKDIGRKRGLVLWLCHCDCGRDTKTISNNLRTGNTSSCGICQRGKPPIVHGHCLRSLDHRGTPTYKTWLSIRQRCLNPNYTKYAFYGGRGIKICQRWNSFQNFLDDMGERPKGYSIDRINNDGNYEPGNCRWATHSQQMKNRRR